MLLLKAIYDVAKTNIRRKDQKKVKYEKLFTPIQINGVELKNRIVMSPMHDGLGIGGDVNQQVIEYFAARAKVKYGAMLAGIGMCPGGLTLGHGIGQLFGAQWHIPHGLGCALGLVPAIRQGVKVEHNDRERYARLCV